VWDGVIRWGGWSLFAAAVLLVVFVAGVVATGQELPVPPEEALDGSRTPMALFTVAAVGEALLAPAALALYHAFKELHRTRMLIAATFLLVASPLFLASRGPILALAQLSGDFEGADASARAGYLAAADLGIEMQNVYSTMALLLLSVASILAGTVMLRSTVIGHRIAYVTIAAGVFSIFTPFIIIAGGPEAFGFIGLALGAVWQLDVGLTLARQTADGRRRAPTHRLE
jgi:hypothetical protein